MSIRVHNSAAGTMTITQTGGWARLFGLPFVAAGLYFLYVLFGVFREYIVAGAAASEWLAALPGIFLIILFGAIFAAPGLVLVFVASKVVIDPVRDTVTDFDRYRRWKVRRRVPLSSMERVQVRMTQNTSGSGSNRRTGSVHQVYLVPTPIDGKKPDKEDMIPLAVFGERSKDLNKANAFGREVAEALDLEFKPRR